MFTVLWRKDKKRRKFLCFMYIKTTVPIELLNLTGRAYILNIFTADSSFKIVLYFNSLKRNIP